MTNDQITTLANYLTDNTRVVKHSVGLSLSGIARSEAGAFYGLRAAFGVSGYATAAEAEEAIRATSEAVGA